MTTGPVDNYLTPDEAKYFEGRGSDEEKFDDTYAESSTPSESDDDSGEDGVSRGESQGSKDSRDSEQDVAQEEDDQTEPLELDDVEGSEEDSDSKRDYKKAFKAERYKRKQEKEALESQAKRAQELEAKLMQLQQAVAQSQHNSSNVAQTQQPQERIPDPEEDPIAYHQYEIQKLKEYTTKQNQYLHQQYEQQKRAEQENAFMNAYKAQAAQFSKQTPDFLDAYNHLAAEKIAEYQEAGYSAEQAERLLIEDEMAIVSKAFADKVNPAERLYKTAKRRGYTGKVSKIAPKKDIQDIKRGMDNSKSLKSGGGERESASGDIDNIDDMNFQEFEDFFANFKAKAKGR